MGSIISHLDDKIEEHGSEKNFRHSLIPSWEERNAPLCEKHNYRGYLCQLCYEEKIKALAELLADCLNAFNEIPNKKLHGKHQDTYSLCTAIEKQIHKT
jgi:hypothetical protein